VLIEREVGLPAPCERAWEALVDWERQAAWMRDADRVEVVSPIREGVGTTVAVATRVLNVPLFTERLEVIVWEPPRRLVMAHRSWIGGTGTWRLAPAGSGCRFRWSEDLTLAPPVLGELALRVYAPFMGRLMQSAMWALHGSIERASGPHGTLA
jgi:uncharacterized protein YndB with AHSA1/START domain